MTFEANVETPVSSQVTHSGDHTSSKARHQASSSLSAGARQSCQSCQSSSLRAVLRAGSALHSQGITSMSSNQLTTQSSLLSGNGKKDPVLSEEQREALNTALSGAFSSMSSIPLKEKGKSKDAVDDASVKGGLRGVPPPLERSASGLVKKGAHGSHSQGGGHASKVYHDHHLSRKSKGSGKAKKDGGGGACDLLLLTRRSLCLFGIDRGDARVEGLHAGEIRLQYQC
jgi:hypothetical protein